MRMIEEILFAEKTLQPGRRPSPRRRRAWVPVLILALLSVLVQCDMGTGPLPSAGGGPPGSAAPDIHLKQGAADLPSGGSYTFAATQAGSSATVTFSLQNLGDADLLLTGSPKVALGGPDAAQFSVGAQPASPVPPGGSLTFSLIFSPGSTGLKQATAAIVSNDPDAGESSYTLQLAGTGQPKQGKKEAYLLCGGSPGQMTVVWAPSGATSSRIDWGADASCSLGSGTAALGSGAQRFSYTIRSLLPVTRYYYSITAGASAYSGSFVTPPAGSGAVRIIAYGDTRTGSSQHDRLAARILTDTAAKPDLPSLVLHSGDVVGDGSSASYWSSELFSSSLPNVHALMAGFPCEIARGNHEADGNLFAGYFPYSGAGRFYRSLDFGPVHVAVVDQYLTGSAWQAQLAWLAADLRATTKPWKVVLMHEPAWSAGGGHPNDTISQTDLQPLFRQYGVQVVIAGHNHYYARAVVDGIQHVTAGGGGAPLASPQSGQPNVVKTSATCHYCEILADDVSLSLVARSQAGSELDRFTLGR